MLIRSTSCVRNSHVLFRFIGKQKLDRKGQYILNLMEEFNLNILNAGEVTGQEGGNKCTIYFVFVNSSIEYYLWKRAIIII